VISEARRERLLDVGLLFLRVAAGALLGLAHGLPKLTGFADKAETFSDPLGVGSTASLVLAIFGELVCSAAVAMGLATRLAAIPAAFTMLVAAFVVHAEDPFGKKELAIVYAAMFIALILTGPGRLSIDAQIAKRRRGAR
jgi:putative oxidoreductase